MKRKNENEGKLLCMETSKQKENYQYIKVEKSVKIK